MHMINDLIQDRLCAHSSPHTPTHESVHELLTVLHVGHAQTHAGSKKKSSHKLFHLHKPSGFHIPHLPHSQHKEKTDSIDSDKDGSVKQHGGHKHLLQHHGKTVHHDEGLQKHDGSQGGCRQSDKDSQTSRDTTSSRSTKKDSLKRHDTQAEDKQKVNVQSHSHQANSYSQQADGYSHQVNGYSLLANGYSHPANGYSHLANGYPHQMASSPQKQDPHAQPSKQPGGKRSMLKRRSKSHVEGGGRAQCDQPSDSEHRQPFWRRLFHNIKNNNPHRQNDDVWHGTDVTSCHSTEASQGHRGVAQEYRGVARDRYQFGGHRAVPAWAKDSKDRVSRYCSTL